MPPFPRPSPCFLDNKEDFGVHSGRKTWRSQEDKQLYQWDSRHGEIEVYNLRGVHLGAADAVSGELIKPADRTRSIRV